MLHFEGHLEPYDMMTWPFHIYSTGPEEERLYQACNIPCPSEKRGADVHIKWISLCAEVTEESAISFRPVCSSSEYA